MDENFIRKRITELRIACNKSEREMSLDLGHSPSYINSITSGRTVPSLQEFLYICEYLDVTPEEFFAEDGKLPCTTAQLVSLAKGLAEKDQSLVISLIRRLAEIKNNSQ